MNIRVRLGTGWITACAFEAALANARVRMAWPPAIEYQIPEDARLLVDAAARLLMLANSQAHAGHSVILSFEGNNSALTYLNRAGFFRLLDASVDVLPYRPDEQEAAAFVGRNSSLVEFRSLVAGAPGEVQEVPGLLADSLGSVTSVRADSNSLASAAFTVFAELIGNVYEHSQTTLVACAALQVYSKRRMARVVVSDCGVGLLETLKPSLVVHTPALVGASDADVLRILFTVGISRFGAGRGAGLPRCGSLALKWRATVHLRLPTCNLALVSADGTYIVKLLVKQERLIFPGTHFCFHFPLA